MNERLAKLVRKYCLVKYPGDENAKLRLATTKNLKAELQGLGHKERGAYVRRLLRVKPAVTVTSNPPPSVA